ncbi:MAG: PEP-CTERM sorting domain-containing protein [Acidobacteriaceae bacterium]|nr:PEP-CTERM sorting domain-containing protein [Acidobacteriaceae bacterium]
MNGIDIVGAPGPSAAVPTEMTYNGPSGTFPFQLVWGQCCGGGSVLSLSLPLDPLPAPEPATFVLISAGLIGIGFSRKIFRRR